LKPVVISPEKVECLVWYATYDAVKTQAEKVLNGEYDKTRFFIHSFKDKLPSDNHDDYMTIYCTLKVKNRSIFHMNTVETVAFELGDFKENVLFSYSSDFAVSGGTWRFSESEETFRLDVYVGNMDENAVRDLG
jgi:hypothetical protein